VRGGAVNPRRGGRGRSRVTLVFKSSQFLQALGNASSRLGLGLLNVLCCVMLPRGLIVAVYFSSISSKSFQILIVNIFVGMLLA
jgi:hypothetical protein